MHAGRTLIQAAVDAASGCGVSLVFFASECTLQEVQALYANGALAPLLPQLLQYCTGGEVDGCPGGPLPPFLVMERGEPLGGSLASEPHDFSVCVAVRPPCGTFVLLRMCVPAWRSASQARVPPRCSCTIV